MNPSYSLSILVPTIDENASLRETVETLMGDQELNPDILEIILVTCDKTSDGTLKTCQKLEAAYESRVCRVLGQHRLPRSPSFALGGGKTAGAESVDPGRLSCRQPVPQAGSPLVGR